MTVRPCTDSEVDSRPLWPSTLEALDVSNVVEHNFANAGARPADRTADDERVLEQVRNGDGSYIDSQEEVGGYPNLETNTESIDVPQSGTHAWLRAKARSVEESE